MQKLLTIAIPTFNRATLLDKQLSWLSQAIQGYESDCEILISDNCSTDNTQEVIKKWQEILSNISFKFNKNNENIGLMRNLAYCINNTNSKYLWVIGDDDEIQKTALYYVVKNLQSHPDLTLLSLNYSRVDIPTAKVIKERHFSIENEEIRADGRAFIEGNLSEDIFGLGFMTAQVYQTEAVKLAIQKWPLSVNNLEGQIYWSAFCALKGSVKFTKDIYLAYACGTNALANPKLWFRVYYSDLPKVYAKLMEVGYSKKFCRELILTHFTGSNNWRAILGGIKRWPILGIKTIVPYLGLVGMLVGASLFLSKQVETKL
ncbi:glycosyltransferase family 2 protein [Mastigocladopsis repens]|uniref:glycosyltransferase family 2 protein n=1 Tax=Mastigocladopsis repens TaxID=221287 RepID=UPI0002F4ECF5|nr:glycosyltransferase family 2 protein [Mastigocladopsis repens]